MATQKVRVGKETLLEWYRQMTLIREFENRSDALYHDKKITGVYLHLYTGSEATGVGAVAALRPEDHVITAYRDHGIAIAKGVDVKPLMAEMMGKRTGVSGGKGGSMHLASREHNMWGGYAIVGGHLPLAAGIAIESRYNDANTVVLCFLGDGASNNGYFHESVNLSAVWDLPVVWLIENNLYGMGTAVEVSSGQPELHKRAIAYGIEDFGRVDGQDVVAVNEVLTRAVEHARKTGPCIVEAMTFRYRGHGVSDRAYAERKAELEEWHARDPLIIARDMMTGRFKGIEAELDRLDAEAVKQVDEAVQFAEESPVPTYEDLVANIYVEGSHG